MVNGNEKVVVCTFPRKSWENEKNKYATTLITWQIKNSFSMSPNSLFI